MSESVLYQAPTMAKQKTTRTYKKNRLPLLERADAEQLQDIPLKFPLNAINMAICEALLFYRLLTEDQLEVLLFPKEPGTKVGRKPHLQRNLKALYHHKVVDRKLLPASVTGRDEDKETVLVYMLDSGGRDELARHRGISPNDVDWKPHHNKVSDHYLAHLLRNNWVRVTFAVAVAQAQALYTLDQSPLEQSVRDRAKQLLKAGYSQQRVFKHVDYLSFLLESDPERVGDGVAWLTRAVTEDIKKPAEFDANAFESPLAVLGANDGYFLKDWLTDRDMSREHRYKVSYIPANGTRKVKGEVELDDEFTLHTPYLDREGNQVEYPCMIELENLTRVLEYHKLKDPKDDTSFATKIRKLVALFHRETPDSASVYEKARGHAPSRLRIFTVVVGGPEALANRVEVTRRHGGRNRFFFTTFKLACRPEYLLTAPIWRKAGEEEERYYPLIGSSHVEKLRMTYRDRNLDEKRVEAHIQALRHKAEGYFYQQVAQELTEVRRQRLTAEIEKASSSGDGYPPEGQRLLQNWYLTDTGISFPQAMAILTDQLAEEVLQQLHAVQA